MDDHLIKKHNNRRMVLHVISGSHLYGTATEDSDVDERRVLLNTPEELLGARSGFDTKVTADGKDEVAHSFRKFARLLLGGNFTLHEWLWTPSEYVKWIDPVFGKELINNRHMFLSDRIGNSITGYLKSQIRRGISSRKGVGPTRLVLLDKFGYNPKAAYHAYRLAVVGKILYNEGVLTPRLEEGYIETMQGIKQGEDSIEELHRKLAVVKDDFERAREKNRAGIRGEPDLAVCNDFVMSVHVRHLQGEGV